MESRNALFWKEGRETGSGAPHGSELSRFRAERHRSRVSSKQTDKKVTKESEKSLVGRARLKDLAPDEKRRIALLVQELAKASGDREKVITELQQASHALELQRESLERERRDKERLEAKFRESQILVGEYRRQIVAQEAMLLELQQHGLISPSVDVLNSNKYGEDSSSALTDMENFRRHKSNETLKRNATVQTEAVAIESMDVAIQVCEKLSITRDAAVQTEREAEEEEEEEEEESVKETPIVVEEEIESSSLKSSSSPAVVHRILVVHAETQTGCVVDEDRNLSVGDDDEADILFLSSLLNRGSPQRRRKSTTKTLMDIISDLENEEDEQSAIGPSFSFYQDTNSYQEGAIPEFELEEKNRDEEDVLSEIFFL